MQMTLKKLLNTIVATESIIPAINTSSYEMTTAVFKAARKENSPVIVQSAWCEISRIGIPLMKSMIRKVGDQYPEVPYAVHLDHGASFQECIKAMQGGFTSVMFDGSAMRYKDNCLITSQVATAAHAVNISVEGEVGVIGGELETDETDFSASLTEPEQAEDFVRKTEIDALAPSVGTTHGFYKGPVTIDIDRLKKIFTLTGIPLVLHGGSGVPVELIQKAAKCGVAKMNFSTTVRKRFRDSLDNHLKKYPDDIDIISIMDVPTVACTEEIRSIMRMCKSSDMGKLY